MPRINWDPFAFRVFGQAREVVRKMRAGRRGKVLHGKKNAPIVYMIGFGAKGFDLKTGYGSEAIVVRVLARRGGVPCTIYDTVDVDMRCGHHVDWEHYQIVLSALTHHFGIPDPAVGLERYFDSDSSWVWSNVRSVQSE